MNCSPTPPQPVSRQATELAQAWLARRLGYTPEWEAPADAGTALLHVLARQIEVQADGVNAMPLRQQLAFLDTLGADLLAAQPARAPVVFKLLPGAASDATVPAGTRVAAVLPPPAPSLAGQSAAARAPAPEFYTEDEITAMRGALHAVYSIDPNADTFADHSAAVQRAGAAASEDATDSVDTGFDAFDVNQPVPHRLLLGHSSLLKLSGTAEIDVSIDFAPSRAGAGAEAQRPLLLDWDYWSVNGWQPLVTQSDGTQRFTTDGKVVLGKRHGPDSEETTFGGHKACWIRATVSNRVPGARVATEPAGYLVRFVPFAPDQRVSHTPNGFWVRVERWLGAPVFSVGDTLKVGGQSAHILAVDGQRLVLDAALVGAVDGALVKDAANTSVGTVLAGPAEARSLAFGAAAAAAPSSPLAPLAWIDSSHAILGEPLPGVAAGAKLFTDWGDELGTVSNAPPEFRVAVDSARDLLAGDVVSVDGRRCARVVQTDETAVYLSTALAGLQPGQQMELANALPPLRPDGADSAGALPLIDVIRAKVGFAQTDLPADKALLDGFVVDLGKDFFPFGEQPQTHAALYLACKSAFPRLGARIELHLQFSQLGLDSHLPKVQAEYHNGARWVALGANENYVDTSEHFTQGITPSGAGALPGAVISFLGPTDWAETQINGDKQLWLRLRLVSGHYGLPQSVAVKADPDNAGQFLVEGAPADLKPPVVARLGIHYFYFTQPTPLQACLAENDFALTDHSEHAHWPRSPFAPFVPVADRAPALHLGFSHRPPAALVSLLVQVNAAAEEGAAQPFVWDYWGERGWTELSVRDTSAGFKQTGLVQFVGPPDACAHAGLGGELFRIRARLKAGLSAQQHVVRCGGLWLNAVWASQGSRVERESLGLSNGNPDQTFALPMARAVAIAANTNGGRAASTVLSVGDRRAFEAALEQPVVGVPVLAGEAVWVREWRGRGDDWRTSAAGVAESDLRLELDPQDSTVVTAAWVRWHAVPHFYSSGPTDRHCMVERARGVFRFPGAGGFVPPAGAPIEVNYTTGGGVQGNVPAGAMRELRSGVGFVQSVSNPLPASGGAAPELLRAARERGAQALRHRDRAVSQIDLEWLTLGASAEVARARALPLEAPEGSGARGWVAVLVVPHSTDARPMPSAELLTRVRDHLGARMPAGTAGRLRLLAPSYVPVSVRCAVLPRSLRDAGALEARLRALLARYCHPLVGGAHGRGWAFGEALYLSQVAALLASAPGVDAVLQLDLLVGGAMQGERVAVLPHQLIAAGDPQLKIVVSEARHALA